METINPLSDEFFRRYGLVELSNRDTFVFNPTIWNQPEIGKIKPERTEKLTSRPRSENGAFRARKLPAPVTSGLRSSEEQKVPVEEQPVAVEGQKDKSSIFLAVFVRLMLIGHNILTVWRVTETYNDDLYCLLLTANIFMIAEGLFTVTRRGGVDYKWWCPCFLIYLGSTLPAIWLLQLRQYELATGQSISGGTAPNENTATSSTSPATTVRIKSPSPSDTTLSALVNLTVPVVDNATAIVNITTAAIHNVTAIVTTPAINNTSTVSNITEAVVENNTGTGNVTTPLLVLSSSVSTTTENNFDELEAPDTEVWLIIIQESLVYLLVFSRWLLPRRDMSREFLADLLLEFLAIASDIMELLAVFDESKVRENLLLTYWVMAVWSASFIQFIPVLAQKRMFRHLRSPQRKLFTRCCGDSFVEMAYTCMSIFLQDGPFLVLRLFIMIRLNLITYSLVFFVLKNAVTVILLVYRLGIMCYRLPCCKRGKRQLEEIVDTNDEILSLKEIVDSLDKRV